MLYCQVYIILALLFRLHEDLVNNGKVHSFLLDIDHRFVRITLPWIRNCDFFINFCIIIFIESVLQ